MAKFGGDVLESLLLPVYLFIFLSKNVQKNKLQTRVYQQLKLLQC